MIGLSKCQMTMAITEPADLFYEYYPKDGCDPANHYGIRRTWEEQLDKKAMEYQKEPTIQ